MCANLLRALFRITLSAGHTIATGATKQIADAELRVLLFLCLRGEAREAETQLARGARNVVAVVPLFFVRVQVELGLGVRAAVKARYFG